MLPCLHDKYCKSRIWRCIWILDCKSHKKRYFASPSHLSEPRGCKQTTGHSPSNVTQTPRDRQRKGPAGRPDFGGDDLWAQPVAALTSLPACNAGGHRTTRRRKTRRIYGGRKEALLHKQAGSPSPVTLTAESPAPPAGVSVTLKNRPHSLHEQHPNVNGGLWHQVDVQPSLRLVWQPIKGPAVKFGLWFLYW